MLNMSQQTIGVVIPTWNSAKHLPRCLAPLLDSPLKPRVLVVDSSSKDETLTIARQYGVESFVIPQQQFNHGITREQARKQLNTSIVVMLTPDAYAVDKNALGRLVEPILTSTIAATYGRQLPHQGADFFESFAREFNYPPTSQVRSLADKNKYGKHTFFFSNSFAAYSNRALDEIGGFQEVLLGEDTVAAAQLLKKGHRIAYVAEAQVYHSHGYGLLQEFRRYFDTGFARTDCERILHCASTDSPRGSMFAKTMLRRLVHEKPYLLPYAFFHLAAKWTGYKLGQKGSCLPVSLKRLLSAHPHYWR